MLCLSLALVWMGAGGSANAQSLPPTIVEEPQSITNIAGSLASFSVTATGTLPLRFQWIINTTNAPLEATNTTLSLPAVQSGDAGIYEVLVANPFGSVLSRRATLAVRLPPTIVQQPSSLVVTQGDQATFTVVSLGDGPFNYQWFFNDTNAIAGAVQPSYTIASAQPTQAGRYSVGVTSTFGSVASTAVTLTVRVPPAIAQPPAHAAIAAGSNHTLGVSVAGDPPFTYQWFFNGTNVLTGQTNDSLSLIGVQPAAGGSYSVFVANLYGSAVSPPALLTVQVPPAIVQAPSSLAVTQGYPAAFNVLASGDALFYQWFFNRTNVLFAATNRALSLLNAQPSQTGNYSVVVTNLVGTALSDEAFLTVLSPPSITRQPTNLTVTLGQTAVFSLLAAGDAPLTYQWRMSSTNLPGQIQPSLTVSNVSLGAHGAYDVVVQNPYGALTSRVAVLTVLGWDFGDAPDPPYPTLQANDGARHIVLPGIYLGSTVSINPDGQPNDTASGDVNETANEEDGVSVLTPLRIGQPATVQVVASTNGLLNAWIDFEQSGSWAQAQDQIFTNRPLVAGTNTLAFVVSSQAVAGQTYARFRFSTAANLLFTGQAPDGEVEDYQLAVAPAIDLALGTSVNTNRVSAGNNAAFTINVTNRGPSAASAVWLTNVLSGRSSFVSATANQGACSHNAGVVICDLGNLAVGARATVTLTARIGQGTNTTFSTASAAEFEANVINNSAAASVLGTTALAFVNSDTIILPLLDRGPGSIYPSTLSVSGVTSVVLKATVTLHNLNHDYPDDIDILLVGPRGQKTYLMSDCGLDNALTDVSITLDDDAAQALPDSDPPILDGGTYRPSNYGTLPDDFASPAPPPPYATNLAVFRNVNPNGVWSFYMMDDQPENGGPNSTEGFLADGWTLTLLLGDPLADLGIKQTAPPGPILVGDHILYSIAVTNFGPAASLAVVQDALPTGMSLASATPSQGTCANDAGTVTCNLGNLASGGTATVLLDVLAGRGGLITNAVNVSGPQLDLNLANNTATSVTSVVPLAELELNQSLAAPALLLGRTQTVVLVVTNHGPNTASGIVLTNVLPPFTTVIRTSASQGACTNQSGVVWCSLGSLAQGSNALVQIVIQPGLVGIHSNFAAVAANEIDPIPTNNFAIGQFSVSPAADLSLAASPAQASLLLGQPAVVTLGVTNRGPSAALVTVTNQFPAGFNVLSAIATRGACKPTAAGVECALGALGPGEFAGIVITANPSNAGTFTNLVTVGSSVTDPTLTDLAATNIFTFIAAADVAVGIVDRPHPVWLGDDLICFITVTNRGPLVAAGVALTNQLPAGIAVVSSSSTRGTCSLRGAELACDFGSLAPGEGGTVTVQLHPTALGILVTRASVVSALPDPNPANNTAAQATPVVTISSILTATNRTDIPKFGVGNPYPSTIFVSGLTAAVAAVRVTLTNLSHTYPDDLDILLVGPNGSAVELMSDAGGEFALSNITLTFDDYGPPLPDATAIPGGFARPTNYELEPDLFPPPAPPGPYGTHLSVFAGIDPNGPWSLYIVDDADKDAGSLEGWSLTFGLGEAIADLVLGQTISSNPAAVGNPVTLTYTVTNRGPANATNTGLTNSLPHAMQPITVIASSGACTVSGDVLTCNFGKLAPGTGASVTVTGTPASATTASNVVAVGSGVLDPQPADNSAGVLMSFESVPIITLNPISQSVTNGDRVQFVGAALGSQPLRYQWSRNGLDVPGATNPVLVISQVVPANAGTYRLRVSNRVGVALSTLALLQVYGPPTISDLPALTIDEDTSTPFLAFTVFDFESPPESLGITADSSDYNLVPPSGLLLQGAGTNRTLRVTPLPNAHGIVSIFIFARDTDGGVSSNSFLLTIRSINDIPVLSPIPNQVTLEDVALQVSFGAFDVETDPEAMTYSATSSNPALVPPANITFAGAGASRVATILPALNQSGSAFITILALDADGGQGSTGFLLTVAAVNDPPTLDPIADQSIVEDSGPLSVLLNGISSGAPNEAQRLTVIARSSNPAVIPNPAVLYQSPAPTGTLTLTPLPDAAGSAVITVTVKDGQATNGSFSRSFTVNVSPVNDPPSLSRLPDQTTDEDVPLSLPIAVHDLETAAGDLVLTASSSNTNLVPDSGLVFSGSGADRTLTIIPGTNQVGTVTIAVAVTDADGASDSFSFGVTFQPVNDPPTLDPVPDLAIAENAPTQTVTLTGISAGAPDETEPVTVTALSSDVGLIPEPTVIYTNPGTNGTLTFRPSPNATGTAVITLRLDDGQPLNHQFVRTFTVTVGAANDPPVISGLSPQATDEDTPIVVPFTVSDSGTPLFQVTLSATSTNPVLVAVTNIILSGSGANRTATISPRTNQFGTTLITIQANDGARIGSNSFVLTVAPVNDPPTLNALTNVNLTASPGQITIPLSGISPGAPNETQTLTVTASNSNPALFVNAPSASYPGTGTNGTLTFRPANNAVGAAVITVTVNDGGTTNNTFSRSFILNVRNSANTQPTISIIANQTTPENTATAAIPFTVRDAQTAPTSLTVFANSSNPSLLADASILLSGTGTNRTVTLVPAPGRSGTAVVTLTAYDPAFGATNLSFTLTVTPVNDPPTVAPISNVSTLEDVPTGIIPVLINDVDSPVASLTVSAVSSNPVLLPNANILIGGSGFGRGLILVPALDQSGTATITVRVSDGAASNSTAFVLTVTATNDPPEISALPPVQTSAGAPSAPIPFTVRDSETAPEALVLSAQSSNPMLIDPAGILFDGTGTNRTLTLIPALDQEGTADITISVADGDGGTARRSFVLTVVRGNVPPTLDPIADVLLNENDGARSILLTGIGPGGPNELQMVALSAQAGDPNLIAALVLNYTSPANAGTLSFRPVPNTNGTALITVTVNDGAPVNHLTSRTFSVIINAAPVLGDIPDQVTLEDIPLGFIPFNVFDADTPASLLSVSAISSNPDLIPPAGIVLQGSGSDRALGLYPATNLSGIATITLTVTDTNGASATNSFEVSVLPVVDPILIEVQPQSTSALVGQAVTLRVGASSTLRPITYQWRRNGQDIAGATASSLTLANLVPVDSAAFTVVLSNADTSVVSAEAILQVVSQAPPSRILSLSRAGSAVTVTCTAAVGPSYRLEFKNSLADPAWTLIDTRLGNGSPLSLVDPNAAVISRYYRVSAQ